MPKDTQTDPRRGFVPRFLPWLLAAAMFCVFGATLNHWITLLNVSQVAAVSGWNWRPQITNPILFLVTQPFRWLPTAQIPVALNCFSALCAAATLGVLARSVAILPHDRTEMERDRERNDLAFLTGWVAWIPPITAVIFCGLQSGFWQHATSFTGESFEVLWFAVILWQLLEYRLDEHVGRLFLAALLFGAGITENWALVGFFPLFVMMVIWLRKLDFFQLNFIAQMLIFGLVGLMLFFLLPVLYKLSGAYPLTFWNLLEPNLQTIWSILKSAQVPVVRHDLALMSLTTLVPAFLMAIRWSATFGDSSRIGSTLVNYTMHVVNLLIFATLLWTMLDPALSPQKLMADMGMDVPALTFYYVTALCIGFYCGYAMLVFGKAAVPTRRNPRPDPALPSALKWLCPVIVAGTLLLTVVMAGLLLYRNTPIIRAANGDILLKYATLAAQELPPNGAVVLSDSDDPKYDTPVRAYLLQAVLARDGRTSRYPIVDTKSLDYPTYHHFLHKKYPGIWPQDLSTNDTMGVSGLKILELFDQFSKSNSLCYLNPSFGYYFESYYQEPHGLIYVMKPLPVDNFLPPALSKEVIAENVTFWNQALAETRPAINRAQNPIDFKRLKTPAGILLMRLHITDQSDENALKIGEYMSRDLDTLGVLVQRADDLDTAASLFQNATDLNSNNIVAGINLEFNKNLRAHTPAEVNLSLNIADQFGKYNNWNEVLTANGPFDETSFCFENGVFLIQGGLPRQAAALFNRVRRLVPDNLAARLALAQIYSFARRPDQVLEVLHDPLTEPARFGLNEFNSTELNVLASSAYFQKNENAKAVALLEPEVDRHPDDETLQTTTVQSFFMRGLYTNALHVINKKLVRSPDEPSWVYGKGFASLQVGAYDDAIVAFTHLLQMQSNNLDALFNRGYAYYQDGQLNAARKDFGHIQDSSPTNYNVAYGLGEIAWRQKQTNEAVRNFQIYVANAPTNTAEMTSVRQRLSQLGGK